MGTEISLIPNMEKIESSRTSSVSLIDNSNGTFILNVMTNNKDPVELPGEWVRLTQYDSATGEDVVIHPETSVVNIVGMREVVTLIREEADMKVADARQRAQDKVRTIGINERIPDDLREFEYIFEQLK